MATAPDHTQHPPPAPPTEIKLDATNDDIDACFADVKGMLKSMMEGNHPTPGWRQTEYEAVNGDKKARRSALTGMVITGGLSTEKLEYIQEILRGKFSKTRWGGKYDPYIDTVLFPEFILQLAMHVENVTYKDAVTKFDHYDPSKK